VISKVLIIVEGIADVIFLRDYIKFLKNDYEIDNTNLKKNKILILQTDNKEIKILIGGGYTTIGKLSSRIKEHIDTRYKIIIIQDADNPNKENGGVINRMKYLNQVKSDNKIDFNTFLFPNDKDDGDLETLLLRITKEPYNVADKCYENYIKCCEQISKKSFANELKDDKSKVFNYFRTYYGMKSAKEENRCYESKYWNFNDQELSSLEKFLKNII
jgi:hypothetical protein